MPRGNFDSAHEEDASVTSGGSSKRSWSVNRPSAIERMREAPTSPPPRGHGAASESGRTDSSAGSWMRRGERDRPLDRIDAPKFLPNRAVCVSTELTLTPSLTFPSAPIVAGNASRAPGTAGLSQLGSPMRPPRDSNSTAPPQSPSPAEAARFELAENARLALEAKSAQVEGLKVKLAAAEAALRERDEREREEQRARAVQRTRGRHARGGQTRG